jgi:hypothetical protein
MPNSSTAHNFVRRIGIAGHQGLPARTRELVSTALRDLLVQYIGGMVGVTCLADGADQLFARIILDLGSPLQVVVPAEQYRDGLSPQAQPAYDQLIAKADRVERLPFIESTEAAHMAGGRAIVDRSDLLLAVWDGAPARGYGGTADVVAYARERRVPVMVIWPEGASRG